MIAILLKWAQVSETVRGSGLETVSDSEVHALSTRKKCISFLTTAGLFPGLSIWGTLESLIKSYLLLNCILFPILKSLNLKVIELCIKRRNLNHYGIFQTWILQQPEEHQFLYNHSVSTATPFRSKTLKVEQKKLLV